MQYVPEFESSQGFHESDDFGRQLLSHMIEANLQAAQVGENRHVNGSPSQQSDFAGSLIIARAIDHGSNCIAESLMDTDMYPTSEIYTQHAIGRVGKLTDDGTRFSMISTPQRPRTFFDLFQPLKLWTVTAFEKESFEPKISINRS